MRMEKDMDCLVEYLERYLSELEIELSTKKRSTRHALSNRCRWRLLLFFKGFDPLDELGSRSLLSQRQFMTCV
jgi:hypothetical protein